jgi:tRNA(Ile)-lysidine synthase
MRVRHAAVTEFENRVFSGFASCGAPFPELARAQKPCMLAVSGGADSIALLTACVRLVSRLSPQRIPAEFHFLAVTVDHGIRPEPESFGDALFVEAYCKTLPRAACRIIRLSPDAVQNETQARRRGKEDAARALRYRAFEAAALESGASAVCLAHTKNDQCETLLLRFLQGSAGGIPRARGIFVRPLLDISRNEIESYLAALSVGYRTDRTNSDTRYARNRVRHELAPALDRTFPGWQRAVFAGYEKTLDNLEAVRSIADRDANVWSETPADGVDGRAVQMTETAFFMQPRAVRRELLYGAFTRLGVTGRIPYRLVAEICDGEARRPFRVSSGTLEIERGDGCIRVTNCAFPAGFAGSARHPHS